MTDTGVVVARTDAGMLAVWCPSYFRDVDGYEAWEARVNERLAEAITAGELVPVNIQSDGAFGVRVAVDPEDLTERERRYALLTSEPYLLAVSGGALCLSGIEGFGDDDRAALRVEPPDGRYAIRKTIVAWDEEPGARGADGSPTDGALPDFVVRVSPERSPEWYRAYELTFDQPE
ncbi:MAG: hypothetical protein ACRDG7_07870 [Candidatus Limnocylindria bacterium]